MDRRNDIQQVTEEGGCSAGANGYNDPIPVSLLDRTGNHPLEDIMGLSLDGDDLWVAARDGVYRVKGMEKKEWDPKITITNAPSSSFFRPIFVGDRVKIEWQSPRDLAADLAQVCPVQGPREQNRSWRQSRSE